jgi:putative hemolysin
MIELIFLILGVIIFSGVFSGTEAAILSVTPSEVEDMVHKKLTGASTLAYARKHLNRSIMTVLILNNIVNIVGSILVGQMVINRFGSAVLGVITTALTFGIIIFSEIVPKSLATHYARYVSRMSAPWVVATNFVFLPFSWPLEQLLKLISKGERTIGTESQIRSLVRIANRGGHIEQDEGQLIDRAFNLNDVKAGDMMTKREKIMALPETMTVGEAGPKIIKDPLSRFPIFAKNLDNITGIVLETEVLAAYIQGNLDQPLKNFARPPLFAHQAKKADDLLVLFRNKQTHMAIVQTKARKTAGLVTLEDVLEELVGEIEDERDAKKIKSQE